MSGGAGFPIKTFDNNYSKVVYFNGTDPNTATIFSSKNPVGVVDEPNLKNNTGYLYVGTDYKTWFSDGNSYSTYIYSGGGAPKREYLFIEAYMLNIDAGDTVFSITSPADITNYVAGDEAISPEALAGGVSIFTFDGERMYKNNTFKIIPSTSTEFVISTTIPQQQVTLVLNCKLA